MPNLPITTDEDTQKLTKTEEAHVRALEHLADHLEESNLLYGSALDGMESGVRAAAEAVDAFGLKDRMAKVENDIAQMAADTITADVAELTAIEQDLVDDDEEEDVLLAGDEEAPPDPSV